MSTNAISESEETVEYIETVTGEFPAPQEAAIVIPPSENMLPDDKREQLLCELEALLFVTSEPLAIQRLAELTGQTPADVQACLSDLEMRYADRGITIRTVGGGYRFATAPRARATVELLLLPPKTSLSPAALETLAVVAYSQPVTKAEIEAVRGVSVDGIVSSLVEKGFLVEAGRKETIGRPMLFATTQEFLESFGLPSLADLPPLPNEQLELLQHEAHDEAPALEGTTESGIASPEIEVEIVDVVDVVEAEPEAPPADELMQPDEQTNEVTIDSAETVPSHDILQEDL